MKKPYAIPVFISLSFILGTGLGLYFPTYSKYGWGLLIVFGIGLLWSYWRSRKQVFQDNWFAFFAFACFLGIGVMNTHQKQVLNDPQHYLHQELENELPFLLQLKEELKSSPYYYNYIAEVEQIDTQKTRGKILLSIRRDSLLEAYLLDTELWVYHHPENIQKALNPYQFDYADYMARRGVYKRIRVSSDEVYIYTKESTSLVGKAAKIRRHIKENLVQNGFSNTQINLIEALLLGQRTNLDRQTYAKFSEAGVVHILAVSGLHIGIILYFLWLLFKPLTSLPYGKSLRQVLALVCLWGYALLAGLSPSVLRAVTMFTFLSLGFFVKRKVFSLNMLCLSALVLLWIKPTFLLEIGFQLSYMAVLSILLFFSKIRSLVKVHSVILRKIADYSSITVAAQLGVLPLSLYYFHQFPGLFFISNLLIVPFLGLVLGSGLLILLLTYFFIIPQVLVKSYGITLDGLLELVSYLADQDQFLWQHIYFSTELLLITTVSLALLAMFIHYKQRQFLYLFLMSLLVMQGSYRWEQHKIQQKNTFYVFHSYRTSILGHQRGKSLRLYRQDSTRPINYSALEGLQNTYGISKLETEAGIKNYYELAKRQLFIIDSLSVWELPKPYHPTDILLIQSPQINLNRVIDSLQPRRIIADGSNYLNRIMQWKATCREKAIPFYYTGEKGALQIEL